MAGITREIAEAKLTEYLDAETKIMAGQSISMNGRSLSRANLGEIQKGIEVWNARAKNLSRGGMRSHNVAPQG